jgi:O-succinylbenzoic acid--CoA ligase
LDEFLHSHENHPDELKSVFDYLKSRFDENISFITSKTSGSTGKPKPIQIQKKHLAESASKTNEFFGINATSNLLLCLSTEFIAGKMMIERALLAKSKLTIVPPSLNPIQYLDTELKIDFAAFTPAQAFEMIQNIHSAKNFEKIDNVIIGGGIVSEKLEELLIHLSNNVYVTFGMTETISHFALRKVGHPYYKAISTAIKISVKESGQMFVDIPYLDIYSLNTNDIIKLVDQNTFQWLGRADFVINSGGIKLHPEQIEQKIEKYYITDGSPFFVFGLPDEKFGQVVGLVLENQAAASDINTKSWTKLGQYEIPKRLFFVDKIAKTATGKIKRIESLKKLNS